MRSFVLAVAIGLIGAAIVHVVIIMSIPDLAPRTAWARVSELGAAGRFRELTETGKSPSGLAEMNPFLRSTVCVFDATDAPIHVNDEGEPPFWSLSVFDPQSNEIFSMNDRSAVERRVDLTLATSTQMTAISRAKPETPSKSILVELPQPSGYVVLRTIAEDATWDRTASRFLSSAECAPLALP